MDRKTGDSLQDSEVIRKGPWTMEEDLILINYIANYGEGVWNSLAKFAGNNFISDVVLFYTPKQHISLLQ